MNISKFQIFSIIIISAVLSVSLLSCQDELDNVGTQIVENNVYNTSQFNTGVIAYTLPIERNRTDGELLSGDKLLGVWHSPTFGTFEASVVSQLLLPSEADDYGTEATLDSVMLHIPFKTVPDGSHDNGTPKFAYDEEQVWTQGDKSFHLSIFRNGTYLNALDPGDPSQSKPYYSDEAPIEGDLLYDGSVTPSLTDTLIVIDRYRYPQYPDLSVRELYMKDSIKEADLKPSLNIPLDTEYFQDLFIDQAGGPGFASQSNFNYYFRGLILKAVQNTADDGALMKLNLNQIRLDLYYTALSTVNEAEDEDLDNDGVTGETGVSVHTPFTKQFQLGGVHYNLYHRDYSGSGIDPYLQSPDSQSGEDKVFVQGAAGSTTVLKVFGEDYDGNGTPDMLDELKTKNWLINDAQLIFYVAPGGEHEVNSLILYNRTDDTEHPGHYLDKAYELGGPVATLEKDDEGNPLLYRFHITDLIAEIIKPESDLQWKDLAIKVYENDIDIINSEMNGKEITEYSGAPEGVVLYGNATAEEELLPRLVIYYTEKE